MWFSLAHFIFLELVSFILTENITLSNLQVKPNNWFKFYKFTYNNYTRTGDIRQGISYSLSITNYIWNESSFHLIVASPSLSLDIISICLRKFDDDATELAKEYPYYRSVHFTTQDKEANITDAKLLDVYGVYTTYWIYCSSVKTDSLLVNGVVSYFNTNGFASAENFYQISWYLLLTFYYVGFTIYWIIKLILNTSKIKPCITLFSIIIPIIIIENIMRLEYFNDIEHKGIYNKSFKIMEFLCRIVKNILIRYWYYWIALGKDLTSLNNHKKIIYKDFWIWWTVLFGYLILSFYYEVSLMYYETELFPSVINVIFSSLLLLWINVHIWWTWYKKLQSHSKEWEGRNWIGEANKLNKYRSIIYVEMIVGGLFCFLLVISKALRNYSIILYMKWVIDLIEQSMSIIIFTGLIILLWSNENEMSKKGYVYDVDLNKSHSNNGSHSPRMNPKNEVAVAEQSQITSGNHDGSNHLEHN